ncbi:MAG: vitamin K epoxide reductase family protein [Gammaproteobacteria bacterium]|nr:vitamin K epoxide reductase family protein [Gammaproteobacteria bacterium]
MADTEAGAPQARAGGDDAGSSGSNRVIFMGKKRKDKKHGAAPRSARQAPEAARPAPAGAGVLLALAVAGMLLTAYLSAVAWLGESPAYCAAGSSCDVVQSSRWSTLLGVPLALWGLVTYALLAGLVWRMRTRRSTWPRATFVACIAAGISLYLTAISVFVIGAVCAWCLASLAIILAILAGLLWRRPAQLPGFQWRSYAPATLLSAALVVLALHLHWSGVFDPSAGPEKPYLKALAMHLDAEGARFYGAYWCPHCQEQKELFEASAARLPYVECTPQGRNGPVNAACATQGIADYPTWIIGGRKYTGVLTPERLASLTRFVWRDPGTGGS